jgi:hypothetical protein
LTWIKGVTRPLVSKFVWLNEPSGIASRQRIERRVYQRARRIQNGASPS